MALAAIPAFAQIRMVPLPSKSPTISLRLVFTTGAADDPEGKPGVADLTARMLVRGTAVAAQVDKEMTAFYRDFDRRHFAAGYLELKRALLAPGWNEDDFQHVRQEAIHALRSGMSDAALAQQTLYESVFQGTAYAPYSAGTPESLLRITLEDVERFYRNQYSQSHLVIGLSGQYPANLLEKMKQDFRVLPAKAGFSTRMDPAPLIPSTRVLIVERHTPSVTWSIGFPILVNRNRTDFAALAVAVAWYGQQENASAALEFVPRGAEFQPNRIRRFNLFEISVRPAEPSNAKVALQLALGQLEGLVADGMAKAEFERTRASLAANAGASLRTASAALGDAVDSMLFPIAPIERYLPESLARLTLEEVNLAIRRHLRTTRLVIAGVAPDGEALKRELISGDLRPEDIAVIKSSVWN